MNKTNIAIILTLLNYLVGSISSAKIIARKKKDVDISRVGFKTAGGSNIAESVGLKWGILVGTFDILKGIPIVAFAKYLQVDANYLSIIALSSIVGHCWPIWFALSGGRGLATFIGTSAFLFPRLSIYPIIIFLLTFPFWYLRKKRKFEIKLLSSPTLTLAALILFAILSLKTIDQSDNIFAFLTLVIILLRRISARPKEYSTYNPFKLLVSRLIFDNSDTIK